MPCRASTLPCSRVHGLHAGTPDAHAASAFLRHAACCPLAAAGGCTICDRNNKNRPSSITFTYKAGQGSSQNQQGDKASGGALFASFPASIGVTVAGGFSQQVSDGQQFTVQAPGGKFDAYSTVSFSNGQSFEFHTSCSVPIMVGDVYGPLTIVGGGSCPVTQPPDPCGRFGCCTNAPTTACANTACTNCPTPPPTTTPPAPVDPCDPYGCCPNTMDKCQVTAS